MPRSTKLMLLAKLTGAVPPSTGGLGADADWMESSSFDLLLVIREDAGLGVLLGVE